MEERTWRAPGRVNLIGEHTDYNDGFTLPMAIQYGCTARVRFAERDWTAISAQVPQAVHVPVGPLAQAPPVPTWSRYVIGAAWLLHEQGLLERGLVIEIDSDVPMGAGLSSSAAVVCSVLRALDDLLGTEWEDGELLALARAVENRVVGVPTGGMDQLVALSGRTGHAVVCDMRSLTAEPVPFAPHRAGLALLVVDTREPHAHAEGEYAARRAGCERAASRLGLLSLRDAGLEDLDRLTGEELRLARHVVSENERVGAVAALLREGRLADIGPLLTASHASMREDFEITVPQVDVAVDALLTAGALGARMTGGGFGGCVIALVPSGSVEAAAETVREAYEQRGWSPLPEWFVATASAGAHRLA